VGSLERRLRHLEKVVRHGDAKAKAFAEFLKRLSVEQLRWLLEPSHEGQSRVPCPHMESLECVCRSDERRQRAMKAFPELLEESGRRIQKLYEEVMNEH
jgi:hypothetical protein